MRQRSAVFVRIQATRPMQYSRAARAARSNDSHHPARRDSGSDFD
jgi:hypothetical protein